MHHISLFLLPPCSSWQNSYFFNHEINLSQTACQVVYFSNFIINLIVTKNVVCFIILMLGLMASVSEFLPMATAMRVVPVAGVEDTTHSDGINGATWASNSNKGATSDGNQGRYPLPCHWGCYLWRRHQGCYPRQQWRQVCYWWQALRALPIVMPLSSLPVEISFRVLPKAMVLRVLSEAVALRALPVTGIEGDSHCRQWQQESYPRW